MRPELAEKVRLQEADTRDQAKVFGLNAARSQDRAVNAERKGIENDKIAQMKQEYQENRSEQHAVRVGLADSRFRSRAKGSKGPWDANRHEVMGNAHGGTPAVLFVFLCLFVANSGSYCDN